MAHPLDGVQLKVVRAHKHLESLNEEIRRYIDTEPYEVVTKMDGDNISVTGPVAAEPPSALACIVGDFVTNLRASLDYIAWELAKPTVNTLPGGQQRKVTFPIVPSNARFTETNGTADHLERICLVPAAAISVIESVQPYHAGYEPLRTLDSLVRIDKHRALLLCAGFVNTVGRVSIYHGDKLAWGTRGMTGEEMDLIAFGPPLGPAADYRVEVNEKPTILISLKDFPPPSHPTLDGMLGKILECVENIIPRFNSFF